MFTLRSIEQGEYIVHATKNGYLVGSYGAKRPFGALGRVKVAEDARVHDVVIRLWPEVTIEGRVTDERGAPVMGATVRAISRFVETHVESAITDDRGTYRISQLQPGEYTVAVQCDVDSRAIDASVVSSKNPGFGTNDSFLLDQDRRNIMTVRGPMPAASKDGRRNLYMTSFFNGSTFARAEPVRLGAGQNRPGVDITLRARPAVRVSGRIVGPTGSIPGLVVGLRPEGDPADLFVQHMSAVAAPGGDFSFLLAPSGRYALTAQRRVPPPTPVRFNDRGEPVYGYDDVIMIDEDDFWLEMPLTIANGDISNLELVVRAGTTVSGKVIGEDGQPPQVKQGRGLIFSAVEEGPYGSKLYAAQFKDDGSFSFKARPGRYFASGPSTTSKMWLKTMSLNGKNIADGPFIVGTEPITGLEVVLSPDTTKLEGTILGTQGGSPVATVVIFPVSRTRWDGLKNNFHRARKIEVDEAKFEVSGMLPDEYFVAAVDDSLMDGWPSAATLERLSRVASRIRLSEGVPSSVTLTFRDRER